MHSNMLVLGAAIFVQRQNNREPRGVPRSPGIHIIAPPTNMRDAPPTSTT